MRRLLLCLLMAVAAASLGVARAPVRAAGTTNVQLEIAPADEEDDEEDGASVVGSSGGSLSTIALLPDTSVAVAGKAYPGSTVVLLRDGQIVATASAGDSAAFAIGPVGVAAGTHDFGIASEDRNGVRSALFSFSVNIMEGASIQLGGIFIAPTVAVDRSEVQRGQRVALFGHSVPGADMRLVVSSDQGQRLAAQAQAAQDGFYAYGLDTSSLESGRYSVLTQATSDGETSPLGQEARFVIAAFSPAPPDAAPTPTAPSGPREAAFSPGGPPPAPDDTPAASADPEAFPGSVGLHEREEGAEEPAQVVPEREPGAAEDLSAKPSDAPKEGALVRIVKILALILAAPLAPLFLWWR